MPNTTLNYKNYRSNTMESRNGRPTSGHCIECGTITSLALGGKRVTIPSQKNGVWVCNEHRGKKNLNDYCDENDIRVGKGNADGISISIELESMGKSTSARAYFVKNKFLPTYDRTVDIEYKSPIYTSELPLAKIVGAIEYMNDSRSYDFSVNNENCGIHTHFGFIDNHFDFRDLYVHYKNLFKPLNDIIKNMSAEKREEIFGRDFENYNRELSYYSPNRHENWINIQHRYTLEIRMPRFTSAVQYMRFLKTFKKIFKALNTFYINRGQNEQASIKAGRKMAKIFEKEYLTERVENTTATVDNTNIEGITLTYNPVDGTFSSNSNISSTAIPVTINYDLTNSLNYDIIASDRTYPNAVRMMDGVPNAVTRIEDGVAV